LSIKPKTIWLQIGVVNLNAAKKVKAAKINFVMDRCPKIEYARLNGELGWGGINSGIISSKKIKLMR
ncbi:CoA-binding protein, partial [Alphaproteobacteria bacterium]|nr:CoA-binding protein [Alphaproteobacteria bacterium]